VHDVISVLNGVISVKLATNRIGSPYSQSGVNRSMPNLGGEHSIF